MRAAAMQLHAIAFTAASCAQPAQETGRDACKDSTLARKSHSRHAETACAPTAVPTARLHMYDVTTRAVQA